MTPLYTKSEAAAILRVSTRQIDRWCATRLLAFSLAGSRKRFSDADLETFLASRSFGHSVTPSAPARTI